MDNNGDCGFRVSVFDDSAENHFRAIDRISQLCGEDMPPPNGGIDDADIHRLSSSVTFLREWRLFNYEPRNVRFEGVPGLLNLRQFSSAVVPRNEELCGNAVSPEPRDFVMYTGGPVWGMDWCPRACESPDSRSKCEFIAISAHPPGSSYHNMGAPLSGRGFVQIWCVLNIRESEVDIPPIEKPKRGRKKSVVVEIKPDVVKRPRGRPRKNPTKDHVAELDGNGQHMQPLDIRLPENSSQLLAIEGIPSCVQEQNINEQNCYKGESACNVKLVAAMQRNNISGGSESNNTSQSLLSFNSGQKVKRPRGRPRKMPLKEHASELDARQPLDAQVAENLFNLLAVEGVPGCSQEDSLQENIVNKQNYHKEVESLTPEATMQTDNVGVGNVGNVTNQQVFARDRHNRFSFTGEEVLDQSGQDPGVSCNISNGADLEVGTTNCSLLDDVTLPRVVLCLAHNGKVAWDVKWRPLNAQDSKCKHRMGFLAVLLGNGSLEVWEVPLPHTVKVLYSSSNCEGTDPRFVKLKPVFRCSMLKSGGVQSIPLSVEWSASAPHDFLLAGCHDGTVALWKFSTSVSSKDTRPLLCFSADTAPIRVVSWAPVQSDSDGGNVIVTAGHEGLKFWDIRDPFRPLWDIHQAARIIYGLDWLPDPRCLVLSFDDGTMKILSLTKAACDVPVTGHPFSGTKQLGLHSYYGSSYAIWSVQVSRPTGMVAYCGADGTVVRFQLTAKAVDKDFFRNRAPHFLCCSLSKDESSIKIDTPIISTPFPLKSLNKSRDTPLALRDILSESSPSNRADKKKEKRTASNDQTLALCDDIDPPGEKLASLKRKKLSKSSSSTKKKPEVNLQLVPVDDESESKDGKENEKAGKHEVLPSKDIAVHRVRWNMNNGSERWLCYGGAAGIVRCQEIVLSEIDQKWAKKK